MEGLNETVYFLMRFLTCGIWGGAFLFKVTHLEGTYDYIRSKGFPEWMVRPGLYATFFIEVAGCIMMIFNIHVWLAASVWFLFIYLVVPWFHGKWIIDGQWNPVEMNLMLKNVSQSGGLLALIALDPARPAWLTSIFFG